MRAARPVLLAVFLVAAFALVMESYLGAVERVGGPWAAGHAVVFCRSWVLGLLAGALAVLISWYASRCPLASLSLTDVVVLAAGTIFFHFGLARGLEVASAEALGRVPAGLPLYLCPNWPVGLLSGLFAAAFARWAWRGGEWR